MSIKDDEMLLRCKAVAGDIDMGGCTHCDTSGGENTYANQACLPLNGRVICVDWCIHQIVAALNAAGVKTTACCCGHGKMQGRIDLEDGRVLLIENPPNVKLNDGFSMTPGQVEIMKIAGDLEAKLGASPLMHGFDLRKSDVIAAV